MPLDTRGGGLVTLAELARESDLSLIRGGELRCLLRVALEEGLLLEALRDAGIDPQSLCAPQSRLRSVMGRALLRLQKGFRLEIRLVYPR